MPLRNPFCILVMLAPLWLGGCADTAPSERGFKPFASLMRSDDQTLTKEEQKAAITELKNDKSKQAQQAGQEATAASATPASATPAKAAQ
ncbi:MAG TPA: hypothetical protein VF340_02360 [Methyloceanibacter sp.]|jgi:hypothetical protein